jgi:hypothetical protein
LHCWRVKQKRLQKQPVIELSNLKMKAEGAH